MLVSTFFHLQYFKLLQLHTCRYTGASLCSYFPTNKTCKINFTGKWKKSNQAKTFIYLFLKNSKMVWKSSTPQYPKVLLSLHCLKLNFSHIKPRKLNLQQTPNPRISSRTHLMYHCKSSFSMPTYPQVSRELLKNCFGIFFTEVKAKDLFCTQILKKNNPTTSKYHICKSC